MKKLISVILAAILAASVLASCAGGNTGAIGSHIRLTSSDAKSAAAWLEARLGESLTGEVVLGTNADGYGVDLSSLENDGYFIRSFGREDVLLAKTATGLDRAVRRYAKAVESGTAIADETYHEGFRVKKLTIAGNDISEYAIIYDDASSACVAAAGNELATFIEKSCGVTVPRFNASEYDAATEKPKRKIILTEDIENVKGLGDEGFQILVSEDGTLTINGGKWRGALYGVWDLLEENIGWRFLGAKFIPNDRTEWLIESDHVDLTPEINRTETPDIPIIRAGGYSPARLKHTYNLKPADAYGSYGWARATCHGLQSYHSQIFSGEYADAYRGFEAEGRQPCFTDEYVLEAIEHFALKFVQDRLDAGQQIGKELTSVDLGHWDALWYSFCQCKNCQKVEMEEGNVHSGPVVRMGNRICALFDEKYPGMCASVFGYCGTDKPCKTDPAHNLYISFCYHVSNDWVSCQNHCLSGKECSQPKSGTTNYLAAKELEAWAKKMDPAMLQVWMYPSNSENYCFNAPLYRNAIKDCRYLRDLGVGQLFIDSEWIDNGLINEELTMYLYLHFAWECDVTEEEELSMMREWFGLVYGKDAGDLLYELSMFAEKAGDRVGCWSSLGHDRDYVDYEFVAKYADKIRELCDKALELADSATSEALIEKYITGFRYMTLVAQYEDLYVNGTVEQREFITARYREWWDTMKKYHLTTTGGLSAHEWLYLPDAPFDPDIHPRMWLESEMYETDKD